jgi:hypothetical protein
MPLPIPRKGHFRRDPGQLSRRRLRTFLILSLLAILTAVFFLVVRNGKEARTALGRLHGAEAGPSGYENRARLRTPRAVDREDAPLPVIAGNIYSTDGRPIAGATVAAATFEIAGNIASKASAVESDEDGHFTLSVPEGTYQINARKEGYGPAATMSHSGSTVSLLMPKSGVVKGHVYDEHRLPVRYFTIEVVSEGANDMPAAPPLWSRRFDSLDGPWRSSLPGRCSSGRPPRTTPRRSRRKSPPRPGRQAKWSSSWRAAAPSTGR